MDTVYLAAPQINQKGFTAFPVWVIVLAASFAFLIVMRKHGSKLNPSDSPLMDRVVDIMVLLSAASVVASISSWPLVQSVTKILSSWTKSGGSNHKVVFGLSITAVVIAVIAVVATGFMYEKTETIPWLIGFGFAVQVLALFWPWVNTIVIWWINHPVQWLWNLMMFLVNYIPNISFGHK